MQHQTQLENYLRQFRLATFIQNYQAYAQDAARTGLSYEQYLLALCTAEAQQRDLHRVQHCIAAAKFPVVKDLASFDFSAVQNVSKAKVMELAQGGYMTKAETIILIGNPGLGKTRSTHYPY